MRQAKRTVCCWISGAALLLGCGAEDRSAAAIEEEVSLEQALTPALCIQETDCDPGLACVAGACRPCSEHAQCDSDVCDRNAATSMGPGACVPEEAVVYVDRNAATCETGDGSRADPVCEIQSAIPLSFGVKYALRVYPGRYRPFGVFDRTLYVFGPADGSAYVGEEDNTAAVRVADGSTAVLDGLDFSVHVLTAVVCEGSSLKLSRGSALGDYYGIRATDCDLELDRVRARGAIQSGLQIAGAGTYRVTNSYFSGGDLPAVMFTGPSTGTFMFNTVTGGGELSPGGIDCGTTPRMIRDSIVVGNAPAVGGAQTAGACIHRRVVVGSGDTRPLVGLIHIDPDLDAQGRLLDTPADRACCIDAGAAYVSSLYTDFFGTPRRQGSSNDIGAHELPQVLRAIADSHFRTDLDIRRNDNYGCQESMVIGSSRGGGGIPWGGPDAMRALVQFDLSGLAGSPYPHVQRAILEMTVDSYDHGLASSVYQVNVHRVVPSGSRTPWVEGNGLEIGATVPPGCTNVDAASGVAWAGAGDGGDDDNQTQPDFDPAVAASATIHQATHARGDVIRWDLTQLVQSWRSGAASNHGILLRDVTGDGSFRGVRFGARDGLLYFPVAVDGPRLFVTLAPHP